jgi:hypothetical protein
MAIPKMTDDLNIIQALSDLPNSEDGLTAEELKAKFDAAGLAIQNFINNTLVPAVVAAKIPFAPTNEIDAETIQAAIENVQAQVRDAASGTIVNGSVTKEKIASALLERIYGGRVWVSADTPDAANNMAADFPIGQVWLRPRFTVVNEAGDSWNGSGCTAAVNGKDVTITGSAQVASVTATQNLSGIGEQGDRVYILFSVADKDSEITGLTAVVNGADAVDVTGDTVLESALSVGGTLTVQFGVQWPSTSLAKGSVTMKSVTVVNVDKIMRQLTGATEIEDWAGYLWAKAPFTSFTSPEALFVQANNGEWSQISFEAIPADRGGTGLNAVQPNKYLRSTDQNKFELLSADEMAEGIGALRMKTGTYTGTGAKRTITLPVTPKILFITSADPKHEESANSEGLVNNTKVLTNGSKEMERWEEPYGNTSTMAESYVSLSGNQLLFTNSSRGGTKFPANCANESGTVYTWTALY